ncbi:Histone acetyltransferase HPA2 [Minicystis rosea]|nr:Histone acetyltransferase HPA2 [Minicystis rosea]
MLSNPTIRPAARADMPAVARLAAKLVRFHHALDPHRFMCMEPLEPGYERWLTRELGDPEAVIVVAEREGVVIGYAYGRVEERNWNALLDAHGALHDVFVDEAARARGVGEALVESVCARLRALGAPRVVLHTATQNVAAQKLFAKMGFRSTMIEMTREL